MPLDNTHQHSSSDIMQHDAVHTPIETGGGQQAVRLLGPFHVAHDDSGLADGIKAFDLVAGSVVFMAGILITEGWDGAGTINLAVGGSDWALGNFWNIGSAENIDTITDDANAGAFAPLAVSSTPAAVLVAGIAHTGPGALIVNRSASDTTGEADVYALIAEPA